MSATEDTSTDPNVNMEFDPATFQEALSFLQNLLLIGINHVSPDSHGRSDNTFVERVLDNRYLNTCTRGLRHAQQPRELNWYNLQAKTSPHRSPPGTQIMDAPDEYPKPQLWRGGKAHTAHFVLEAAKHATEALDARLVSENNDEWGQLRYEFLELVIMAKRYAQTP